MKKGFKILLCLCAVIIITGCSIKKGKKQEEKQERDIEIKEGFNTYAVRKNESKQKYVEKIVRFDTNGNFKYYEMTQNVRLDEISEEDKGMLKGKSDKEVEYILCSTHYGMNKYKEAARICKVENHIYIDGYSITDKTIGETSKDVIEFNYISGLSEMLTEYSSFNTESNAVKYFENYKSSLNDKNDILIIANKKVDIK